MFTRKGLLSTSGRAVALATVAAFALTAFEVPKVQAAEIRTAPVAQVANPQGDVTDFSSQRRYRRGGGNPAAAIAAFGIVAGTIAAAAAASNRRDHYYYGGGPAYYGGPVYYDAPAYYSPGYGYYGGGYSNSRAYRYEYGGN